MLGKQIIERNSAMNFLEFKILESAETNDHQVRVFVDRKDIMSLAYLGLDPLNFNAKNSLKSDGWSTVGRCSCGVEGCDDLDIDIEVTDHSVVWRSDRGMYFEFVKSQYISALDNVSSDHSWEDNNRTAERLVSEVFREKTLKGNFAFKWASARIEKGVIRLSFEGGYDQKLFDIKWDGENPDTALASARLAIKEIGFYE